jgi:RND family efflux transporter MFP subunit
MVRNLTLILAAALLVMRCAKPAESQPIAKDAELPPDVQAVATAAPATPEPVAPATSTAAPVVTAADGQVSATGEFISPSRSEVAPRFPGRVARVFVDAGARVSKGQPLFALESQYMTLDVQRAQAELARATAAANEAGRDFERKKGLLEKKSIPQSTFDRSQSAYEQAQAARQAAASAVNTARQRLNDTVIHSPITGVVAERRVDVGEHLGEAGIAFVINQTAPLKLRFQLPERYLGQIREGQSVSATVDPYPNEKFTGTIKTVGGVIDPQSRTLFAEAEFANRDGRLRPGLFARVETDLR